VFRYNFSLDVELLLRRQFGRQADNTLKPNAKRIEINGMQEDDLVLLDSSMLSGSNKKIVGGLKYKYEHQAPLLEKISLDAKLLRKRRGSTGSISNNSKATGKKIIASFDDLQISSPNIK